MIKFAQKKIISENLSKKLTVAMFALGSSLSLSPFSQAAAHQLPDDLDYRKYQKIYIQKQSVSDQRRSEAQVAKADLDQTTERLQQIGSVLAQNQARFQQILKALDDNRLVLMSLDHQIKTDQAQIPRLKDTLNETQKRLDHAKSDLMLAEQNFENARRASNAQRQANEQTQQALNAAVSVMNTAQSNLDAAQSALQSKTAKRNSQIQEITALQNQLPALELEIKSLNEEITKLNGVTSTLQAEVARLQNQSKSIEKELALATDTVATAQSEVNQKQKARTEANAQVELNLAALKKLNETLVITQKKLDMARLQLERATTKPEAAEIKKTIDALTLSLAETKEQLARQQTAYDSAYKKYEITNQEWNVAQASLKLATSKRDEVQQRLNPIAAQIKSRSDEVESAKKLILQKTTQLNTAKAKQAQNSKQITDLTKSNEDLTREIALAEKQIRPLTLSLQTAKTQEETTRRAWTTGQDQMRRLELSFNNSKKIKQDAEDRYADRNQNFQRALQNYNETVHQLNANLDAYDYHQDQKTKLTLDSEKVAARISIGNNDFERESQNQAAKSNVYSSLNQIAIDAENNTARAESDYRSRLNRYTQLMDQAIAIGNTAGTEAGKLSGEPRGTAIGSEQGRTVGSRDGKEQGLLAGYQQGLKDGDAAGYAVGYERGKSNASEFEAGRLLGVNQGKVDAKTEATKNDYPRAQLDRYQQLTSKTLSQNFEIDLDALSNGMGSSFGSGPHSIDDRQDQNNRRVRIHAKECNQQIDVFKVAEFKEACEQHYQSAFDTAEKEAYDQYYQIAYDASYEPARTAAYSKNLPVRVNEGFKAGQLAGDARGFVEGSILAQQKGVILGRKQGYDNTIVIAKAEAYQSGTHDTDLFFSKNPVLIALESTNRRVGIDGSTDGSYGAGDQVRIDLKIANYGSVPPLMGTAKVSVEAADEASRALVILPTPSGITLPAIMPLSNLVIKNALRGVIPLSATAGGKAILKIKFSFPGLKTQELQTTVMIAPVLKAQITSADYDSTPKIGRTQKVKVYTANTGDLNPTERVTVELATNALPNALELTNPNLEIFRFQAGASISLKGLTYVLRDTSLLPKDFYLQVRIKHGNRVVAVYPMNIRY
jgi:hypothetical protein